MCEGFTQCRLYNLLQFASSRRDIIVLIMVKCCNTYKHMFTYIKYAIYLLSRAAEMADIPTRAQEGRKEMFYLTTHSTHFIYSYMASHIW